MVTVKNCTHYVVYIQCASATTVQIGDDFRGNFFRSEHTSHVTTFSFVGRGDMNSRVSNTQSGGQTVCLSVSVCVMYECYLRTYGCKVIRRVAGENARSYLVSYCVFVLLTWFLLTECLLTKINNTRELTRCIKIYCTIPPS